MGYDNSETSELSDRECWARLRDEAYGRLAVIGADGPVIYPINALVDHGSIVFRTHEGLKLDAMRADPRVSFEVDGWEPEHSMAWSVIVAGTAREVTRMHEGLDVTELGVTPWQAGPKPIFIRIVPTAISGRMFRRVEPGS
jgi:nitroimidazol reductase NimA-like FMN-containing flavoprotein (pyridoxamine 5'-phosphate oxidase superfamily)